MPRKVEIVSNNIAAKRREVSIGKKIYIVRRSGVFITNENFKTLQLLDFLKNMNNFTSENDNIAERLAEYVKYSKIKRADIDQYISAYPDATYRYFYETGLEYVLT